MRRLPRYDPGATGAGPWSIYGKASDFGRSFVRPLIIYFILFLITLSVGLKSAANSVPDVHGCNENLNVTYKNMFNLPCLLYSKNDANNINLNGYRAAFEFAAYRASGIIDFSDNDKQTAAVSQRVFGQPIEPGWARAWGIFKAIASTALLFLAALGLRNKYRIK